tara:strand:+ start:1289 stop:1462 length:174 start_codon:yes stop_codon:yes gene_type:complete
MNGNLTLPDLTAPHPTKPQLNVNGNLTLPYPTLPYPTLPYQTLPHQTLPQLNVINSI